MNGEKSAPAGAVGWWRKRKPAVLVAVSILDRGFGVYADVSTAIPATNRPERFVVVERTGGRQRHPATDEAWMRVDCYAKKMGYAEDMAGVASEILRNSTATTVTACLSGGPVDECPADQVVKAFIRAWDNEVGPTRYDHPDVLDYVRFQLTGTLHIKSN